MLFNKKYTDHLKKYLASTSLFRAQKINSLPLCLLLLLLGLIFIFSSNTLIILFESWQKPEYNHCLLLIAVAAGWGYSIYRKRKLEPHPSYHGLYVVLFAVFMNIFGDSAANDWINQYALVIMIAGLVMTLGGTSVFRAVFPALFVLSFTIPLPPLMLASMTAKMQLMSSTLSVAGLDLLGIPVYQEGNIIDLGNYKLQVAEACSGLRYLFPFMGFGYLFGMFFETTAWKRVTLILITIPVTIIVNAMRIVIVGMTVNVWGIKMAEGGLHEFEGLVFFAACLLFLMFIHWMLSFIGHPAHAKTAPAAPHAMQRRFSPEKIGTSGPLIALIAILCLGIVGQQTIKHAQQAASPQRESFATFPLHISSWSGQTEKLPPDQIGILQVSDYFLADFKRDNTEVNFYIAYYASQRHGAAPHSPLVCINGAGWEITKMTSDFPVVNEQGVPLLHVNRALIKNGEKTELVYFWFRERGRNLTLTSERKWYLFQDAIMTGRTDGALVRIAAPISKNGNEADADKLLASFLAAFLPLLKEYIPD